MSEQIHPDLTQPEAYLSPEVRSAAQAVARLQCGSFGVSETVMFERLTQGKHPKMIRAYLQSAAGQRSIAQQCRSQLIEGNWGEHWIEFSDAGSEILIRGPYDADLGGEVLRAHGHWCSANLRNRRCFVVPMDSAERLLAGMTRWMQASKVKRQQIADARNVSRGSMFRASR